MHVKKSFRKMFGAEIHQNVTSSAEFGFSVQMQFNFIVFIFVF